MKNIFKLNATIIVITILFFSCKKEKEEEKSLAAKLDNNTMMFNGKKLTVNNATKDPLVAASCSGLGLAGKFFVYAGNSDRDSIFLAFNNISSYSGNNNLVEYGLNGNQCKTFMIGNYKLGGGSWITIKSGYSGILEFNASTCLFREESIGVNVPPNVFTAFGTQVSYPCYWKCTF
jgi:hypothetical protein